MTTAIVTITCPACGGQVEGVRATDAEQTIPCTFCRTELHIPRVGEVVRERVVREVVREVPVVQPVLVQRRGWQFTTRSQKIRAIVAIVFMLAVCLWGVCRIHAINQDYDAKRQAEDRCEASCKHQCAGAGDKERFEGHPDIEQSLRKGDVMVCETECELAKDCMGRHH